MNEDLKKKWDAFKSYVQIILMDNIIVATVGLTGYLGIKLEHFFELEGLAHWLYTSVHILASIGLIFGAYKVCLQNDVDTALLRVYKWWEQRKQNKEEQESLQVEEHSSPEWEEEKAAEGSGNSDRH